MTGVQTCALPISRSAIKSSPSSIPVEIRSSVSEIPAAARAYYMINNLLLHSDVCCLGIDIVPGGYQKYGIKALKIETCEPFLAFGYVTAENASLSPEAEQYLERLTAYL